MKKRLNFAFIPFLLIITTIIFYFNITVYSATLFYDGVPHEYNVPDIRLVVNGVELTGLPVAPVNIDGRVYVPAREVFEYLGAVVDWKGETKQVYIGYGEDLIVLKINSDEVNFNGDIKKIPVVPKNINDKTMIPVRFAAELLGFEVSWNEVNNTVFINEKHTVTDKSDVLHIEKPEDEVEAGVIFNPGMPYLASDISDVPITTENHPETKICNIILPSGKGYSYQIVADSAISRVNKFLYDNRLVVDIYNAEIALSETKYTLEENPYLNMIRAAQNQVTPIKITRVVFELSDAISYRVALSPDRKVLTVSFEKNYITGVTFQTDGASDYVIIEGLTAPVVSIFPLPNPDRVVVDIPLAIMNVKTEIAANGIFTEKVRTSQFEPETARVVIDLKTEASYNVTAEGNKTIIKLSYPTYKNISFSSEHMLLSIPKSEALSLDIKSIIHDDRYDIYKYSMILPGDYSHYLGEGERIVKDLYVSSINIQTMNGKTVITFNENKILAFDVKEDDKYIYFQAMLPREKYKKIIVIDPGHGAADPGTEGSGMKEKSINLDLALRLIALLEVDPTVKVYATRKTDVYPSFDDRVNLGNTVGDLYISLHHNAYTTPIPNGTETYYNTHALLPDINYSSRKAAEIIQKNLLSDLGLYDRKAKASDFYVIKHTNVPSVLVEVGFLTNPGDAAKIATSEFRQKAAESLYRSIIEIFSVYTPPR